MSIVLAIKVNQYTFLSTYTIKGELVIVVTNSPLTRFSDICSLQNSITIFLGLPLIVYTRIGL